MKFYKFLIKFASIGTVVLIVVTEIHLLIQFHQDFGMTLPVLAGVFPVLTIWFLISTALWRQVSDD